MNTIILGAGRRGIRLAKHLIQEKKSVVVVDSDALRCQMVAQKLDCMAVCGSATDIEILKNAGADDANAIIAVTDSDEVNLVACGIAASNFPKATTIAAIRGISYLGNGGSAGKRILGIDHIVNPEEEAAKRMTAVLKSGLFSDVVSFEDAAFILFRRVLTSSSPFIGKTLIDMKKVLKGEYIIIGIRRGQEILSPSGNTVLQERDEVAVMAGDEDSENVYKALNGDTSSVKLKRMRSAWLSLSSSQMFSSVIDSFIVRI